MSKVMDSGESYGESRVSGMGDAQSDLQSQAQFDPNIQTALDALHIFWQTAQSLNPQIPADFGAFLEALKHSLTHPSPKQDEVFLIKISGIGNMINTGYSQNDTGVFPPDRVQAAMIALAQQGQGRLPADLNGFAAVLTDQGTHVNFLDAITYTATESAAQIESGAKQVAKAVQETGQTLIDTGSAVIKYKNYIMIALALGAAYVLYKRGSGLLDKLGLKANPEKKSKKDRWDRLSKVQSLLFHKAYFTEDEAIDWARAHRFAFKKVEDGKNYWRIRQHSPAFFDDFRTIEFTPGVKAVLGPPKRSAMHLA